MIATELIFALALSISTFTVHDVHQAIYDAAVNHGVAHSTLYRLARCETGGTLDPDAVGDHGTSFGVMQLHRPGELDRFYAMGYESPFNPYEALDYAALAIRAGRGSAWTCW